MSVKWRKAVADPGFSRGGGANSSREGGRQHRNLPNFPKTCMKLKEFGSPGGRASLAPPLRSASETIIYVTACDVWNDRLQNCVHCRVKKCLANVERWCDISDLR